MEDRKSYIEDTKRFLSDRCVEKEDRPLYTHLQMCKMMEAARYWALNKEGLLPPMPLGLDYADNVEELYSTLPDCVK